MTTTDDAAKRKDSLIGQTIAGRFALQNRIGSGGMGILYRATRLDGGGDVAVKVLHPELTDDPEVMARFDREMRLTSSIEHPNSVLVHECGAYEHRLYLAMELLEGRSLDALIQSEAPLAPARTAHIGAQIARALGAAHAVHVVHRDLKPENVMIVERDGDPDFVKVLDFGLSRMEVDEELSEGAQLTQVGVRVGTPTYMAPEYVTAYAFDHRSDLYALGVIVFEMATGQVPFTGRPFEILEKAASQAPPVPSSISPGTAPRWLDALVAGLLAKKPGDRPQTAALVAAALEAGRVEALAAPPVVVAPAAEGGTLLTAEGFPTRQRDYVPLSAAAIPTHLLEKVRKKKPPAGDAPATPKKAPVVAQRSAPKPAPVDPALDEPTTEEAPPPPASRVPTAPLPASAVPTQPPPDEPAPSNTPYVVLGCLFVAVLSAAGGLGVAIIVVVALNAVR